MFVACVSGVFVSIYVSFFSHYLIPLTDHRVWLWTPLLLEEISLLRRSALSIHVKVKHVSDEMTQLWLFASAVTDIMIACSMGYLICRFMLSSSST